MKKLVFLLAVAVMVTPAMALVMIAGEDNGGGTLTISYTSDPAEAPRGIALLLSCSDTLEITGYVTDSADDKMNCFIDYAYSNDPYAIGDGDPLADPANPGVATLPAAEVSICMGVLDETGSQLPGNPAGDIATLTYTGAGDLTIAADTLRGPDSGVVGSEIPSNLSAGPIVVENVGGGTTTCWDYDCFLNGDVNGDCLITFADIQILIDAWPPAAYDMCADLNQDTLITFGDLQILIDHWPPLPGCDVSCVPAN